MGYASDLVHGQPTQFSLGTPAAVSANAIAATVDADATAGNIETLATVYTMDSTYGRSIRVTPSGDPGAAGGVVAVHGFDYLGQPMAETFSGANGSTAIIYGKKAFKRVTHTRIVTATTNAVTWAVGTGWRFGLPYKGDVAWAKENGVFVPVYQRTIEIWRNSDTVQVAAGPSGFWFRSPVPGYISALRTVADMPAGSTNDPVVTVELGGVAVTGLTLTIDTSAAATGNLQSDAPTTAGYSANNRVRAGDLIEIVISDIADSGPIAVGVEITSEQFSEAVETDPQTLVTGDPRGTYESLMTPTGSAELVVGMYGDNSVNSSGNGGLHGIRHVTS
jgi:hypothetical protein